MSKTRLLPFLSILFLGLSACGNTNTDTSTDVNSSTSSSGSTVDPVSVSITNDVLLLTPGEHELNAQVLPEEASQDVFYQVIGSIQGVSVSGSTLTIAATSVDGTEFNVKVSSSYDPTVNSTTKFTVSNVILPTDISTEEQLRNISLNNDYVLVNDIVLTSPWVPLGTYDDEDTNELGDGYKGVFDGNGYTIKGFTTEAGGYIKGFFSQIDETGIVRRLGLESNDTDGLKGSAWCGVIAGRNKGLVENCFTNVTVTMSGAPGASLIGTNVGTIRNCYTIGNVSVASGTHGSGLTNTASGTIINSYALNTSVNSAVGYNQGQNANIQKSAVWLKIKQHFADANWNEDVWYLQNGRFPILKNADFTEPAALVLVEVTNAETVLDYEVEAQRTLQITHNIYNAANSAVVYSVLNNPTGVDVSATGLLTISSNVIDRAVITVVVTSVQDATASDVLKLTILNAIQETSEVLISTEAQLRQLATSTIDVDYTKHYILLNDIELTEEVADSGNYWSTFIGSETYPFNGIFDGNGYTISNVKNSSSGYKVNFGFFGRIGLDGEVCNLTLDTNGILYTGTNSAIFAQYNYGSIHDCMTKGEIRSAVGTRYVAGFLRQNNGTMANCIAIAIISHSEANQVRAAFCVSTSSTGTFTNCIYDYTIAGSSTMSGLSTGVVKFYPSGSNNFGTNNNYTTEYLQTAANYGPEWSRDIWAIVDGSYPSIIHNCSYGD